jgi:hypothetical protein
MAEKAVSAYQNPLDRFLEQSDDDESRLAILARQFAAEPFDEEAFITELTAKLTRLRYIPPTPSRLPRKPIDSRKTFNEILNDSGVLGVLLQRDTLVALWKCILIKKIVEYDRKIENAHQSVEKHPISFHRERYRRIEKDLEAIERLGKDYDAREEVEKLSEKVSRAYRHEVTTVLLSTRYMGSRAELLTGRPKKELSTAPKNEDSACQVHIYRTLKQVMQTSETRRKGISDIFLCQLSELIWAAPNVPKLTDGDTLFRATLRFKS